MPKQLGKLGYVYFLDEPQPKEGSYFDPYNLYVGTDSSIYIKQPSTPNFFTKKTCFKKFINSCQLNNTQSPLILNESKDDVNLDNSGEVYIKLYDQDTTQSTVKIYSTLKDTVWKLTFQKGILSYNNSINVELQIIINDSERIENFNYQIKDNKILCKDIHELFFTAKKEKDTLIQFQIISDSDGVFGDTKSPNMIIFDQII